MAEEVLKGEFQRGWHIVFAAMIGIGLGLSPLPFYTIGVLAPHLAESFGWSRVQIMGGITIMTLNVMWAAPVIGILVEKFSVRKVVIPSLILFSLSFMSFALSTGSIVQFYLSWAALAVFGVGTLPITWTKTVNQWFEKRKGFALGIALMGTGIFGFLAKPVTAGLIESVGWRGAYVGLGLLPLIAVPITYFLFYPPKEVSSESSGKIKPETGMTLPQTLKDWRFWLLGIGFFTISVTLGGLAPNLEGVLESSNMSTETALSLTLYLGLAVIVGRVLGGWLLDRMWAPLVAMIIVAAPAWACWVLGQGDFGYTQAFLAIWLVGFALGVEFDLMAYIVPRYFGMKSYAGIYGLLYMFFASGAGLGPIIFARDFDKSGNYESTLVAAAIVLLICALAFLFLGPYRKFSAEKEQLSLGEV